MNGSGHDLLATEVHHRALEDLTGEMCTTLVRTSGSPVVVESKDFSACVLDTVPEHLSGAAYIITHFGTSLVGTTMVARMTEGQEIRPGDGWIVNDTYQGGAAHQADVGIIMPMFHRAGRRTEHLGWGFMNMHMLDIGGAGVSGVAPGARDVYGEGIRFAGVQAIRDGALDPGWEAFIANNVRAPGPVLNDIRSMIAANNVGARKLAELVDAVGLERHRELCRINKDLTEEAFRARIAALPDGRYRATEWTEFDGHGIDHLLKLGVTLDVDGSDLRIAFDGVPQIDGFVNVGKGGMWGSVLVALLTTLAYGDLPVNGGLWRPISIELGEPGTVVNPVPPAPVSMGHAEVGMRVRKLVREVLSQALALSADPVLRGRVSAKAHDGPATGPVLFGANQHGGRSVVVYLDCTLTGGGAATIHDGQDAYGSSGMTGSGLADVETHEAADPVKFLWRAVSANSGGPGQFRGGQGINQAYRLEYVDEMGGPSVLACAQLPPNGVGGGYPGAGSSCFVVRADDADRLPERYDADAIAAALRGLEPTASKIGYLRIGRGDTVVVVGGGGAGLGDPLLREPALVAADVRAGYITAAHADAAYGVVLDGSSRVDQAATDARRAEARRTRIGAEPTAALTAPASPGVAVEHDGGRWRCASCRADLGDAARNWRAHAVRTETPAVARMRELQMYVRPRADDPAIVLREHFCPACAQALVVDVTTADSAHTPAPLLAADRSAGTAVDRSAAAGSAA